MNDRPELEIVFSTREGQQFVTEIPVSWNATHNLNDAYSVTTLRFEGLEIEQANNPRVNGRKWGDVVKKKDLVVISCKDHKGKKWADMAGMVSNIVSFEGEEIGMPDDAVEITIHDFGRALSDYSIFFHPNLSVTPGAAQGIGLGFGLVGAGSPPKGRPDQVCRQIYNKFFSNDYGYKLADGRRLVEAVDLKFSEIGDSQNQIAQNITSATMSVWETLRKYCDNPWAELFTETDASTESLNVFLRPTPFSPEDWQNLKLQEGWGYEYDSEIHREGVETLQNDEDQVFTFFLCSPKGSTGVINDTTIIYNNTNQKVPVYDEELIRRYGFKMLHKVTEYIQILTQTDKNRQNLSTTQKREYSTKQTTLWDMIAKRTAQLYLWFGYDEFERGQIPMVGRVGRDKKWGIRLGSILTRKRDGAQMYITGYEQSWTMDGTWSTVVTVERVHKPDKYRKWVQDNVFVKGLQEVLDK